MIRFPTEAANADVLGEDTPLAQEPAGVKRAQQARSRSDRPEHRRGRAATQPAAGKPGEDINAAGFIKDGEPRNPS